MRESDKKIKTHGSLWSQRVTYVLAVVLVVGIRVGVFKLLCIFLSTTLPRMVILTAMLSLSEPRGFLGYVQETAKRCFLKCVISGIRPQRKFSMLKRQAFLTLSKKKKMFFF